MVQILSTRLGVIDVAEDSILHFPAGLPGFEHCTKFALLERPPVSPIVFLQSLDLPQICFLAAPVTAIDPAYQLAITPEDSGCIGLQSADDALCLAILSPAESG